MRPMKTVPRLAQMQTRLQRILASAGVASRRQAEALILAGRVQVNGEVVRTLGTKADPDQDDIRLDGQPVKPLRAKVVVLLHKPALVMTTKADPQRRRTVMDLLPPALQHLNPVGRLDFETSGLLLLTNDGELAQALTHPRHGVPKVYHALVSGEPSPDALRLLAQGIQLEEGLTAPAKVHRLKAQGKDTWVAITLMQGWNRQVRRMCETIGHPVRQLKRVGLGPLTLGALAPGEYRELGDSDMARLGNLLAEPAVGPGRKGPPPARGRSKSSLPKAPKRR